LIGRSRKIPSPQEQEQGLSAELLLSADAATRRDLLELYLRKQTSRSLGLKLENLDVRQSLTNMGLDSLMALELKNRIENDLGVAIPMVEFLRGPSLVEISELVLGKIALENPKHSVMQPTQGNGGSHGSHSSHENLADVLAQIDRLSEEEINALLNEHLPRENRPTP
jgi:acyl carrier protein